MIELIIPGKPIPLQRHRHSGKMCFDPQKKEKQDFAFFAKAALKAFKPLKNAIKVNIEYHLPIPRSYSRKKALEYEFMIHSIKPDLSNLIKFTEDALNGILWEDDKYIAEIHAVKYYSTTPMTRILAEEICTKD